MCQHVRGQAQPAASVKASLGLKPRTTRTAEPTFRVQALASGSQEEATGHLYSTHLCRPAAEDTCATQRFSGPTEATRTKEPALQRFVKSLVLDDLALVTED